MKGYLLQAANDDPAIFAYVFVLLLAIAVFFATRGLFLWYWKIDVMVKNQTEQTKILQGILRKLESWNDNKDDNSGKQI